MLDIAVHKNWESHIDASHSRQPLVKGERLVRYEVNAVITMIPWNNVYFENTAIGFIVFELQSFFPFASACLKHGIGAAEGWYRIPSLLPNNGCVAHSSVPCQCNT